MDYDWTAVIPSLVGGLTGGFFAVIGMLVAGRRERRRIEADRERDAIIGIRQCLLGIEDLVASHTDEGGDLTDEGADKRDALLREMRAYVSAIRKTSFRSALEVVTRTLQTYGISLFYPDSDRTIAYHGCRYGQELVASYLVGGPAGPIPERIANYQEAMDEQESIWVQHEAERQRERDIAREERRLVSAIEPSAVEPDNSSPPPAVS